MTEKKHLELRLSGSSLAGIMQSVVERGALFRFRAKGYSMMPFIRNEDIVTVSRLQPGTLHLGDIAAVVHSYNEALIIHRVVGRTKEGILLKGDNLNTPDGVFPMQAVIGTVVNVERHGQKVPFCGKPARIFIACLSRTGLLKTAILPILRMIKNLIWRKDPIQQGK